MQMPPPFGHDLQRAFCDIMSADIRKLEPMRLQTKLLIATGNAHKMREYCDLLNGLPIALTSLLEQGITVEVEEHGSTFQENAAIKASTYCSISGRLTLADDSGLEVDVLGGEPGIYSSRYAGPDVSDGERIEFLLSKMRDVPWEHRKAHFRAVIAVAAPEGGLWICEGRCEGYVAFEPRGKHGFGYDPVFYLPDIGLTMAELPPFKKNQISHRAEAACKARIILTELASSPWSMRSLL